MLQAKEQALFNLGVEAFKKRKYDNAIEYFTKSTELYNRLRAIQLGEAEDKFGWCTILDI